MFYETPNDTVRPSEVGIRRRAFFEALDECNDELRIALLLRIDSLTHYFMTHNMAKNVETARNWASDVVAELVMKKAYPMIEVFDTGEALSA